MYMEYKVLRETSEKECLYIKYNDFVDDTDSVIDNIFKFFNFKNKELIKSLSIEANPVSNIENLENHKRSGKNYQWKTHLMTRTQDQLNKELNEVLDYWEFK